MIYSWDCDGNISPIDGKARKLIMAHGLCGVYVGTKTKKEKKMKRRNKNDNRQKQ